MRLLHTTEHRFQEFFDKDTPKYAILSHRWQEDEVSFQEMQWMLLKPNMRAKLLTPALIDAEAKLGKQCHKKVLDFCRHAADRGYHWVWVDTVCIDKTSSAELSEAINSMYTWYEQAGRCYAYLSDVEVKQPDMHLADSDFRRSVWFTRSWTLRELIAPRKVVFLNRHWEQITTKEDAADLIEEITGIDVACLKGRLERHARPAATIMFWASKRKASREEDLAYALLGLFNIQMPLLYGERSKAFLRLCQNIITADPLYLDDSILLHRGERLLPDSPACFSVKRQMRGHFGMNFTHYNDLGSYSITAAGRGLQLHDAVIIDPEQLERSSFFKGLTPNTSYGVLPPGRFHILLHCSSTEDNPQILVAYRVLHNICCKIKDNLVPAVEKEKVHALFSAFQKAPFDSHPLPFVRRCSLYLGESCVNSIEVLEDLERKLERRKERLLTTSSY